MNLLIVESKNDKVFIEALLRHIQVSNVLIDVAPICGIDDYECLDGLSEAKLSVKLRDIQIDIRKKDIQRIGIIIDSDQVGIEGRISLINDCLLAVFGNVETIKQTPNFRFRLKQFKRLATIFTALSKITTHEKPKNKNNQNRSTL